MILRQNICLADYPELLQVVRLYDQENGHSAHEEGTVLYLVCSGRREDREVGVNVIRRVRAAEKPEYVRHPITGKRLKKSIRAYAPRKINFEAQSVSELINLDEAMTEPPLTMKLSDDEVTALLDAPLELPHYTCNTQYVERGVKQTSEAVSRVSGRDRQDGLSLNKAKSRKDYKTPGQKSK